MIRPIGITMPGFKGIYQSTRYGKFNPAQQEIIENITQQLRSDENKKML